MRFKPLIRLLGLLMVCEAALMAPSLVISIIYRDGDTAAFLYSMAMLLAFGLPAACLIKPQVKSLYAREGFALVGMTWIVMSLFGMLPFLFSGVIVSPVDAFFETVSGFSTTCASILKGVEGVPHGILFWRSFSQWVGGMGVLVFTIALMPQIGLRNMELLRAESPGPNPEKLLPKIRETAKMLYLLYIGLSAVLFAALLLTGMGPFDSVVNTFGVASTGGFSVRNASIGAYNNPVAEIIIGVFMMLFGVNFSVYFIIFMRKWRKAFLNQELIFYFSTIAAAVIFITIDIAPRFANFWVPLRHSFFQVSSIITTTGYNTMNFDAWPTFSKCILMGLMLMGACAGSTGGGIKVVRILISGKVIRRELHYLVHPRAVINVHLDGKHMDEGAIRSVLAFITAYTFVIVFSVIIVALDGFDITTTLSAVIASISNIGPGFGVVGPMGNFSEFSSLSKLVLSVCMLVGRLEIMPILLLFMPKLWLKG